MSRKWFLRSEHWGTEVPGKEFQTNAEVLDAWHEHNRIRLSDITRKHYYYEISKFIDICGDRLVSQVTAKQFWSYVRDFGSLCRFMTRRSRQFGKNKLSGDGEVWCQKGFDMTACGPNLCDKYSVMNLDTVNKHLQAIVTLYDFLVRCEAVPYNFVRDIKKEWYKDNKHRKVDTPKRVPTRDELELMIKGSPHFVRRVFYLLMAKTGTRVSESVQLKITSDLFNLKDGWMKIPPFRGKRRGNRILIVDDQLRAYLTMYIDQRQAKLDRLGKTSEYLFLNHQGNPIMGAAGAKTINDRWIRGDGIALGILEKGCSTSNRLTSHGFRHFFSDHLKKSGLQDDYWWNVFRGDKPKGNQNTYIKNPTVDQIKPIYEKYGPVFAIPGPTGRGA